MKKLNLEILTPYGKYYAGEVDAIKVHSDDFFMEILPNHAPLVSSLVISKMYMKVDNKEIPYAIGGGIIMMLINEYTYGFGVFLLICGALLFVCSTIMSMNIGRNKNGNKYIAEYKPESNSLRCYQLNGQITDVAINSINEVRKDSITDYMIKVIYTDESNHKHKINLGYSFEDKELRECVKKHQLDD